MKPDKPSCKDRVEHAISAIQTIQSFTQPYTRESFLQDIKTISACLYQYSIVAEATMQIDSSILEKYAYPWHKVRSFRNYILHEYHGIELRLVWDTTTDLLPELKSLLETILDNEF